MAISKALGSLPSNKQKKENKSLILLIFDFAFKERKPSEKFWRNLHKISTVIFRQLSNFYIRIVAREAPRLDTHHHQRRETERWSSLADKLKIRRPSKQIPFHPDPSHTVNLVIMRRVRSRTTTTPPAYSSSVSKVSIGSWQLFFFSKVHKPALESLLPVSFFAPSLHY